MKSDVPNPLKQRTVTVRDRVVAHSEAFAIEYKTDRGYAKIQPAQTISYFYFRLFNNLQRLFFGDYFYRNVIWIWLTWTCFYIQEYLYVQLSMYLPILDWFHIPFFHWPVNFELHFWRLILVLVGLVFLVFAVSQRFFTYASKLEKRLNLLHFSAFFGSVLFYYVTGLAPFILVIILSFIILLHYNFIYYLPATTARARLQPPILLLPPPTHTEHPKLPIFYYHYPFRSFAPTVKSKRFTKFPFLTVSHRVTAPKYVFDIKRSANMLPVPWRLARSSLFNTGKFDETFNCNPYETYERYRFERSQEPEAELDSPSYLTYLNHNPRTYVTLPKRFMWGPTLEPLGVSNVSFFNATVSTSRSIFHDYFTAVTSRDPLRFGRSSRFIHQRLVGDPGYRLYVWLQQMAPYYHAEPLRSRFYQHFIDPKVQLNALLPYPMFRTLLDYFYQYFIKRLVNILTLGYFRTFPRKADNPYEYFAGLLKLLSDLEKPYFYHSRDYAHSSARFLANFSTWVKEDLALGPTNSLLWSNRVFRYEVLVILSDLVEVVEWSYNLEEYFFRGRLFSTAATVRFFEAMGAQADHLIYLLTTDPFDDPLTPTEETIADIVKELFNDDAYMVEEYNPKHHR